ncbi:hypothetical protein EJ08DRAFT_691757 [Tothia fuscella]|uniref:Epoxide hydrolase n=1 Tax=Tothia fuscella TaxID=1048955 RepID=A0A9P4U446_9PEZI|nr:hypothetical protein EJ08DRAFT_691757 [Tothia fuscella]
MDGYQYGNRKLTSDHARGQGNYTLPQPTFILYPISDLAADWQALAVLVKSAVFLPNHYNTTIASSHWPQEELPDQFNAILSEWLGNVTFPSRSPW